MTTSLNANDSLRVSDVCSLALPVATSLLVAYRSAVADPKPNPLLPLAAFGLVAAARWPTSREFPLLGTKIAVTRDARRAASFGDALRSLGASVAFCPTIEIVDPIDAAGLENAFQNLNRYDWVVFTSANGAERTIDRLLDSGRDVRSFGESRVAAIGPATARAVRERGLRVDVVPDEYVAESLHVALAGSGPLNGARVLIARAAIARDVLPDSLRAEGAVVDVVEAYRTVVPVDASDAVRRLLREPISLLVTFTSSSTVANFTTLAADLDVSRVQAACIGPITARTARELGYSVVVEASTYTVTGLVEAIVHWASAVEGGQTGKSA